MSGFPIRPGSPIPGAMPLPPIAATPAVGQQAMTHAQVVEQLRGMLAAIDEWRRCYRGERITAADLEREVEREIEQAAMAIERGRR